MPIPIIFRDEAVNKEFIELGYVKFGYIGSAALNELLKLNAELSIPDHLGTGFNAGMNSNLPDRRIAMQRGIARIISPITDSILEDFTPYTATYLDKTPREDCIIKAHQDFTYTKFENGYEDTCFMCFIPLVDVDLTNGAMGFIPGSHNFYSYVRAFPFPFQKTPVTVNGEETMAYFQMVEMKAGEIVFFNQKTIHGSFPNYSRSVRHAVSLSFYRKGSQVYTYIHNPATYGKTVLQYAVDSEAIMKFNNPAIWKMYEGGEIKLPYPITAEFTYKQPETDWTGLRSKLEGAGLSPVPEQEALLERFKKWERRQNSLLGRITARYKKLVVNA